MSQPKTKRIPAPLYAVAGAGDLAFQQLRKLPTAVTELTGKATVTTADLRTKAAQSTAELRERANSGTDLDRLRTLALRNRDAVLAGAQAASQRAMAIYGTLVAHGERVVGTGVVRAADTVTADMEATEAPAQVTATTQREPEPTRATVATATEAPAATATEASTAAEAAQATAPTAAAEAPAKINGSKPTKRTRPSTK
ncbi:hypothetical protein O7623_24465 [Solwaraspora sp. WMMD791]|uniref:hypothetical protein n=1 Tax=Solwaraspora sp. WMMD791 TaxID=3016086 RepID=UPI00249CC86F|nr:hypothetical protein [Solwaraspora sp. WMMD791]WFE26449.1 hypothetical protein O7623_24465 [Solwaraspora sp. WMMD791]